MKQFYPLLVLSLLAATQLPAQIGKKNLPAQPRQSPMENPGLKWPGKNVVPQAENPFNLGSVQYKTIDAKQLSSSVENARGTADKYGLSVFFTGKTDASELLGGKAPVAELAKSYAASVKLRGMVQPEAELQVGESHVDELGNTHVRMQQMWNGIPVYGGEVIAHTRDGYFQGLNGRYFPTPELPSATPVLSSDDCRNVVFKHFGADRVKTNWTDEELTAVGGAAYNAELVVYHAGGGKDAAHLCWHVTLYPNLMKRVVYFVDAVTGEVINHYDQTCSFFPDHREGNAPPPPVTGMGQDLFNINQSFGAWQVSANNYMLIDASKPMFNAGASNMPSNPVGAIMTFDAFNTSPENQNFNYDIVKSTSTTFNNKKGVSAHKNASICYDYYLSTFNRNSINGSGGNIISFINVSEGNGASMENAYWNGAAMWYGNGGSFFKELARGLDVAGHEMTHGVVEKTANLVYQDEPGALNESFADVFGAMIDRDDWLIGEDVMQAGVSPSGALRSLQDPHNGDVTNGNWWQPRHVNEQYFGNQDNGGVHINSGIPNYAFYLFANNAAVGKDKAEQVYYKALRDYLVKSSQFIDCRIAVIQAATDLYGQQVAQAAADAFTMVGILGSDPGGNYLGQLSTNPGTEYVITVRNDFTRIDLHDANGNLLGTMYDQGVLSRPSISDNGSQMVFVNDAGHIIGAEITYTGGINVQLVQISDTPDWRNAAISKDGRFLAALAEMEEPVIYIVDLADPLLTSEAFLLYNPTTSTGGQTTNDVRYADAMDFDYSGEYLMYDAFNQLNNGQNIIEYWDIAFLRFWENGAFADGNNAFISNLFNGLSNDESVGNPVFSKNSPYVVAFDYVNSGTYSLLGVNSETGDIGTIVPDNFGNPGYPDYNKSDNQLVYEGQDNQGVFNIFRTPLAADKINASGAEAGFIANRNYVRVYANGNRSLMVDASAPIENPFFLTASPNPAAGNLNVSFQLEQNADIQLSLVDQLGRVVMVQNFQALAGENHFDLHLAGVPAGTYALRMANGNAVATLQIVKY